MGLIWNNPPKLIPVAQRATKPITPEMLAKSGTEDGHQAALFCWAAANVAQYPELEWLHAIPNAAERHIAVATKMIATGLRKGVWDIFLPCPIQTEWAKQYAGLYIEMKIEKKRNVKNGGLTDEQVKFGKYAEAIGYYCKVCYSWTEARDILVKYLKLKI